MKKFAILSTLILISGCSLLNTHSSNTATGSESSIRAKMQSCLMSEANAKFQTGTLFTNSISATADELVSTCTQKLALQSLGISQESKSTAENIITNLRNMSAQ